MSTQENIEAEQPADPAADPAEAARARLKAGDRGGALRILVQNEAAIRDDPLALNLLSTLFLSVGEEKKSLAAAARVLALKPDFGGALNNRARAFANLGAHADAVRASDQALALDANDATAWMNRGLSLAALDRKLEALEAFRRHLALRPRNGDAARRIGGICWDLERFDEALDAYERQVEAEPANPDAHIHCGIALIELQRFEEALARYDQAVALKPDYARAHFGRGNALKSLERDDEALDAYDRACELDPSARHAFNRALLRLAMGDWPEPFSDYGRYIELPAQPVRTGPPNLPVWRGEELAGKRIVAFEDQGFGDVFNFCRLALHPALANTEVTLLVRPKLKRLADTLLTTADSAGNVRIDTGLRGAESYDYKIALPSLAGAIGLAPDAIPAETPYLSADPDLVKLWRARIGDHGFRVGVVWQGNPKGRVDAGRSAPLAAFAPLAAIPGVRLISLQKNHGLDQLDALPEGMSVETLGEDYDAGPDAFIDAAAAMESLDLVVSTDTSVPHLAGALGRPVWVALKTNPDWRWLRGRQDSPWYPTMRLFRQREAGDWEPVFADMAGALEAAVEAGSASPARRAPAPFAPVSIGELVDKITILEIKSERIADPAKLANVARELTLLRATLGRVIDDAPDAIHDLRKVNSALWDVEDDLRDLEAKGEFGDTFVELARSVYRLNDRRAALKRDINQACGSDLVEEKSYKGL